MSVDKPHIVHIIPTLRHGGAERLVVDVCNTLVQKGYRASIITFFDDVPLAAELHTDVQHIVVKKHGKLSLGLVHSLKKQLQSLQSDVVHTHLFGADMWGRRAAYACGIPVVTTEHSMNRHEGSLKHVLRRIESDKTTTYIAVSSLVQEYLKKVCRVDEQTISIIHPGITTSRFAVEVSGMSDPLSFLMIGRLSHEKGFDIAIRALARLKQEQWKCTIVGSGSEKPALMQLVKRYALTDRITFQKATNDVLSAYKAADVIIVPSRWEGFGIVPLEAMTAGRIVVGTKTGGMPDLLLDKKTGLIVDPNNEEQLQQALLWILESDVQVRKNICKQAQRRAKKFDIYHMVKEYIDIYNSVL